jgi:GntR family transcriptional regulator/MocR family aminotransferase
MAKQPRGALLAMLSLDRSSPVPLFRQLDSQLRRAILCRQLPQGARLPASRQLARELSVSRLTVQNVYEQLVAEGFLRAATGSGTFVAELRPYDLPPGEMPSGDKTMPSGPRLSRRGQLIATTRAATRLSRTQPFRPGVPALDLFPMRVWTRLCSRWLGRARSNMLGYGEPAGYGPLREQVADYLRDARGVSCDSGQVIITAGTQNAIALTAYALLDPGDCVWIEEPGHTAGRDLLKAVGMQVAPARLDGEGLDLLKARSSHPAPKLIFITPSHQHPLGITMSLRRRLELLSFAYQERSWILEDDYDSEYRYSGRPIAAMQGLDAEGCVIYAGTFSKVLLPSLRIGYVVVPPDVVPAFCAAQTIMSQSLPVFPQAVLAEFIQEGHFHTHLRKMRAVYAERQSALLDSVRKHLRDLLDPVPTEAGMHILAWLREDMDERAASEAAWAAGVEVLPMSIYCAEPDHRPCLILGFTGTPPELIEPNVKVLAQSLRGLMANG